MPLRKSQLPGYGLPQRWSGLLTSGTVLEHGTLRKSQERVIMHGVPRETIEVRVRGLIEQSGQTQEAFGASIGLDSTKLSKALNGKRRFSSLELARIAEACDVTVDWLLSGEEGAVAARVSVDGSPVQQAIREAARLGECRDNVIFLRGVSRRPETPAFEKMLAYEQGEELAEFALGHLGNPDVLDSEDFAAAIERVFGFDVAVVELDGGCDGLAFSSRKGARTLLVATSGNPTRQRFTMAHELAHLLCSDDQGLHVDENVMASSKGDLSEMRANAFAANLLMPAGKLKELFPEPGITEKTFSDAVMKLKVSPSSLAWRLLNLKLASPEQRTKLGKLRTIDCAASTSKMDNYAAWVEAAGQPRIPTRLVRDLFDAYLDGKTTLRPLANLLGVPVDRLRIAIEPSGVPVEASEADEFAP